MIEYLLPFGAYVAALLLPIVPGIAISAHAAYLAEILVAGLLLAVFWKRYKITFRLSPWPFVTAAAIFLLWIGLEGRYPAFGTSYFEPPNTFYLLLKLVGSSTVVAAVEELFTRGFLARYLTARNWKGLAYGRFNAASFVITVLFFGFAHYRWLPALISGVLLNLLIMKERNLGSTIMAHGAANLLLGFWVVGTGSWGLW